MAAAQTHKGDKAYLELVDRLDILVNEGYLSLCESDDIQARIDAALADSGIKAEDI